jgi:hypothetical protein
MNMDSLGSVMRLPQNTWLPVLTVKLSPQSSVLSPQPSVLSPQSSVLSPQQFICSQVLPSTTDVM